MEVSEFVELFKQQYKPVIPIRRIIPKMNAEAVLEAFKIIGNDITGGTFVIDESNTKLYEYLSHWVCGDFKEATKGLYLYGNSGTGKSVSMRILAEFFRQVTLSYYIKEDRRSISIEMVNAQSIISDYAHCGDFEKYLEAPILCINDLGAEICRNKQDYVSEAIYMGNRVNVIKTILELRGEDETKITFITSNFPQGAPIMKLVYGDRVLSRLKNMCLTFELGGVDRRK